MYVDLMAHVDTIASRSSTAIVYEKYRHQNRPKNLKPRTDIFFTRCFQEVFERGGFRFLPNRGMGREQAVQEWKPMEKRCFGNSRRFHFSLFRSDFGLDIFRVLSLLDAIAISMKENETANENDTKWRGNPSQLTEKVIVIPILKQRPRPRTHPPTHVRTSHEDGVLHVFETCCFLQLLLELARLLHTLCVCTHYHDLNDSMGESRRVEEQRIKLSLVDVIDEEKEEENDKEIAYIE